MENEEHGTTCIDQTAERIQFKRFLRRKRKIDKIKCATLLVSVVLALGLTTYAITEFVAVRSTVRTAKARASGIDTHMKDLYDGFVTVGASSLELSLPGKMGSVVAVGFHEAERKEAVASKPLTEYYNKETTTTVRDAVRDSEYPVLFVMNSRGRGSAPTSAIDVAMKAGSQVFSPVDGIVRVVRTYCLYNKIIDYHVEIEPYGYPYLRVAIIHIDNVQVSEGQKVTRQMSLIGSMRELPQIQSQINKYLPDRADHVHMQVNPTTVEGEMGS